MDTDMDTTSAPTAEAFAERMLNSSLGLVDILSAYLGDRLGWYRALAAGGPATAGELVARAGGVERYAQEWLEQQAATEVLRVEVDGRFSLPAGPAEVLTNSDSLAYLAPLARVFGAAASRLPELLTAYREGGGVSWDTFGRDMREGQADINRPLFLQQLGGTLQSIPDVHAQLSQPGALIADVGCGAGWSSIAIAKAYPHATVEGWDIDEPSIDLARANAAVEGVEERVVFSAADVSHLGTEAFDAIFAFECVHDMSHPVEVLTQLRRAVRPGGTVVVVDEAVGESFNAPADDVERLMYGFSLLVCLPDGMSSPQSVGTGTVMRPGRLRGYAQLAGFSDIEVLPVDGFGFFRFYRLLTN